jgi:hypothetical protein
VTTLQAPAGFGLDIGSLGLMHNDFADFSISALGVNATFGDPAPVEAVVASLMADGSLTRTASFGNRVAAFDVTIAASNHAGLAAGEALLEAQLDRPNDLTWRVPFGPPTVFSVLRSWSQFVFDDLDERRIRRTYRVFFECFPFPRSASLTTLNWTAPYTQVHDLASTTGWTVVGAGSIQTATGGVFGGSMIRRTATGDVTVRRTLTAGEYLRLVTRMSYLNDVSVSGVKLNGVAVPDAQLGTAVNLGDESCVTHVDTRHLYGQSVTVEFTITTGATTDRAELWSIYTVDYPDIRSRIVPRCLGTVPLAMTARAPFKAEFTVPTGGAFLYTGPDPNFDLRSRGLYELEFTYTVTVDPPDNYELTSVDYPPQPVRAYPNGVWPRTYIRGTSGTSSTYGYPASDQAAVSFWKSTGAKVVTSADQFLPSGFHDGAIAHHNHVLHPGHGGFLLADATGAPIACTLTFYEHWKHHAAR